jgi:hypothetical protein
MMIVRVASIGVSTARNRRRWNVPSAAWDEGIRLTDPLPAGVTDARRPAADWSWRATVLVEVSPQQVQVRPEWAAPEERTAAAVLPFPAGDLLRTDAPG